MTATIALEEIYDTLDPRTANLLRLRGNATVKRRGWLVRRALLGADLLGLTAAFLIAELLFPMHLNRAGALSQFAEYALLGVCLPVWVVAAKLYGLYDNDEERTDHSTADDFARVFHLLTVGVWLLYASMLMSEWFEPQFGKLFIFWLLAVLGVPTMRSVARTICRRQVHYLQNTIIVGAGEVGQSVARKLLKHPEYGINLVGFVDGAPKERAAGLEHLTILGSLDDLPNLVDLLDVDRVIVAFTNDDSGATLDLIRKLSAFDVQVDIVPRFFEVLSPSIDLHSVEGVLMCGLRAPRLSRSSRLIKRSVDLVLTVVCLVVLAPALGIVAALVKLDSRGPVFFRQVRKGEGDRIFRIWKFRTMEIDADLRKQEVEHLNRHLAPGGDPRMFKITHDPRVTRVGRFLRRFALDELPQLFNVLTGEMSLVGPRPLILAEHAHVSDWAERRIDLRPGMTGLWQVLGRDDIPFSEMVRLDYLYVTSWTLGGDVRLLLQTIPAIARKSG